MGKQVTLWLALLLILGGCTNNLNSALGTLKNPHPTLSRAIGDGDSRNYRDNSENRVNPFIAYNYCILRQVSAGQPTINCSMVSTASSDDLTPNMFGSPPYSETSAFTRDGQEGLGLIRPIPMREYIAAGFALSDFYCRDFFRDADESQRRRRFGRGATSDVGATIATILGLANAGEDLVAGVAASFGFGDALWRNYEDAFVVAPELSNVQALVFAAQDNFRERTLGRGQNVQIPTEFSTAHSVIMRYANFCSTLGMQALLNQSTSEQRQELKENTDEQRRNIGGSTGGSTGGDNGATDDTDDEESGIENAPEAVQQALTPN